MWPNGTPFHAFVCAQSLQSFLTLCNRMDCSPPGFSAHGIPLARILEWVATSPPGHLPDPGIEPMSPALQEDSLQLNHQGSPHHLIVGSKRCCQPDPAPCGGWWRKEVGAQIAHWTRVQHQLWTLPGHGPWETREGILSPGQPPLLPTCMHSCHKSYANQGTWLCCMTLGTQQSSLQTQPHPLRTVNQTVTLQSGVVSSGGNIGKWVINGRT